LQDAIKEKEAQRKQHDDVVKIYNTQAEQQCRLFKDWYKAFMKKDLLNHRRSVDSFGFLTSKAESKLIFPRKYLNPEHFERGVHAFARRMHEAHFPGQGAYDSLGSRTLEWVKKMLSPRQHRKGDVVDKN
jgi:hypothetical protein